MKKLYQNYTFHNLLGHPVMELLYLVGLTKAARAVHDGTLPVTGVRN